MNVTGAKNFSIQDLGSKYIERRVLSFLDLSSLFAFRLTDKAASQTGLRLVNEYYKEKVFKEIALNEKIPHLVRGALLINHPQKMVRLTGLSPFSHYDTPFDGISSILVNRIIQKMIAVNHSYCWILIDDLFNGRGTKAIEIFEGVQLKDFDLEESVTATDLEIYKIYKNQGLQTLINNKNAEQVEEINKKINIIEKKEKKFKEKKNLFLKNFLENTQQEKEVWKEKLKKIHLKKEGQLSLFQRAVEFKNKIINELKEIKLSPNYYLKDPLFLKYKDLFFLINSHVFFEEIKDPFICDTRNILFDLGSSLFPLDECIIYEEKSNCKKEQLLKSLDLDFLGNSYNNFKNESFLKSVLSQGVPKAFLESFITTFCKEAYLARRMYFYDQILLNKNFCDKMITSLDENRIKYYNNCEEVFFKKYQSMMEFVPDLIQLTTLLGYCFQLGHLVHTQQATERIRKKMNEEQENMDQEDDIKKLYNEIVLKIKNCIKNLSEGHRNFFVKTIYFMEVEKPKYREMIPEGFFYDWLKKSSIKECSNWFFSTEINDDGKFMYSSLGSLATMITVQRILDDYLIKIDLGYDPLPTNPPWEGISRSHTQNY